MAGLACVCVCVCVCDQMRTPSPWQAPHVAAALPDADPRMRMRAQEFEWEKAATREASSGRGLVPAISLDNLADGGSLGGVPEPISLVTGMRTPPSAFISPFQALAAQHRSSVEPPDSPSHKRVRAPAPTPCPTP